MGKKISKSSLLLVLCLILLLSFPIGLSSFLRGKTSFFLSKILFLTKPISVDEDKEKLEKLSSENSLIKRELEGYRELLHQETTLLQQWLILDKKKKEIPSFSILAKESQIQLRSIPANVIYRDPTSWSSVLWIDVGERDNLVDHVIIAENSPVLVDGAVVGVIDLVENDRSRVRLLTDSGIVPSVRVSRGVQQNILLQRHVEALIDATLTRKDLLAEEELELFYQLLQLISQRLLDGKERVMLAKGELHGGGAPLWRSQKPIFKGIGFNYDYSDQEGFSRDLRTGRFENRSDLQKSLPLIEEGDLLVTTGMDGVFPSGLPVAIVTKRFSLKEGAYTYEIEAEPVVKRFNDLSLVFVAPPLRSSLSRY